MSTRSGSRAKCPHCQETWQVVAAGTIRNHKRNGGLCAGSGITPQISGQMELEVPGQVPPLEEVGAELDQLEGLEEDAQPEPVELEEVIPPHVAQVKAKPRVPEAWPPDNFLVPGPRAVPFLDRDIPAYSAAIYADWITPDLLRD